MLGLTGGGAHRSFGLFVVGVGDIGLMALDCVGLLNFRNKKRRLGTSFCAGVS